MNKKHLLLLSLMPVFAPLSRATLLVYDGFNGGVIGDSITTLNNTTDVGSLGFSGGYTQNSATGTGVTIGAGTSLGGNGTGNSSTATSANFGNYTRSFSSSVNTAWSNEIATNGEIWISFYISQTTAGNSTNDTTGLQLIPSGGNNTLTLGNAAFNGNTWGYSDAVNYGSGSTSAATRSSTLTKITLQYDFISAGNTTVKAYIGTAGDGLGTLFSTNNSVTGTLSFSGVNLISSATNAFTIDEIRIGTTQADVVSAVPEPSTYGLLGAGALASAALVRRRRRVV